MSSVPEMSSLELCLEAFQEALHAGQRPPLDNFLPPGDGRLDTLIELIHAELEYRLKHGEDAAVERYLERYPELAGLPDAVAELRAAEEKFRRLGPISPTPAELAADTFAAMRQAATGPRKFPAVPGYEILGELGRGGMSIVYRAWQHKLHRMVALKMVRGGEQASPGELLRLFSEAETIAKLHHPNIVHIYEIGQHDSLPYLTLELCNAGSLAAYLKGDPLPPDDAAALIITLARAVHVAHQRGVVHRDLKPGNILFVSPEEQPQQRESGERPVSGAQTREGILVPPPIPDVVPDAPTPPPEPRRPLGALVPKITDFGLAKRIEVSIHLTQSHVLVGTPAYMAPEQAGGEDRKITPAADVYSLGTILFELVAGRPPFKGASVADVVTQVLHDDPPSLHHLNARVPRDLETICLKCLAKSPAGRYATAQELAEDLERFRRGEVIHARPASVWERTWKWAKRHPLAGAGVAVCIAFALALFTVQAWHNADLREANEESTRKLAALREEHELNTRKLAALQAEMKRRNQELEDEAENQRYASDMRVAFPVVRYGDWLRLEDILARHQEPPRLADGHGFDWHYLSQFRLDRRSERRAEAAGPQVLQFGAGGHLLTQSAAYQPENAHLWPVHDGKLGDPPTAFSVRPGLPTHPAAALSPDGKWLALCRADSRLALYDAKTSQEKQVKDLNALAAAFAADGTKLAVWCASHEVHILDVPSLTVTATWKQGVPAGAPYLAFSPDGKTVVAASTAEVRAWEVGDQAGRVLFTLRGPPRELFFSHSGRLLLCLHESTITVWDCEQGGVRMSWRIDTGASWCSAAALSPDETQLATGTTDGQLALWDLDSQELLATWRYGNRGLTRLAFAPEDKYLASADDGGRVVVQRYLRMPPRYRRLSPELVCTGPAAWAPDGKVLAVADARRRVVLLDPATGGHLRVLGPHLGAVDHVAYVRPAPGAPAQVATAHHYDGRVTLWEADTGRAARTLAGSGGGPLRCLVPAGPGALLTVTAEGRLHVWDLATGTARPHPVQGDVIAAAWSQCGRQLATAGRDRVVRLWGGADLTKLVGARTLERNITDVAFSPDGKELVTNVESATLEAWKAEAGLPPAGPPVVWEHGGDPQGRISFSPDGALLLVAGSGLNWRVYEWGQRELRWDGTMYGQLPGSRWQAMEFSPKGKALAVTRTDGTLQVWRLPFFQVLRPQGQACPPVEDLVFLTGDTLLSSHSRPHVEITSKYRVSTLPLAAGRDAVFQQRLQGTTADPLHAWHLPNCHEIDKYLEGKPSVAPCTRIARSPDGRLLAGASEDGSVHVWEARSGKKVTRLFVSAAAEVETRKFEWGVGTFTSSRPQYPEGVRSLEFSPDGTRLLAQATTGGLRVWDTSDWTARDRAPAAGLAWSGWLLGSRTGRVGMLINGRLYEWDPQTKQESETAIGQADTVIDSAALSPDGKYLAAATADQVIQLWDLKGGGMRPLIGHHGPIRVLAFSPDGRLLASGGQDGLVRLWNAAAGQEVAALDGHRGAVTALRFRADGKQLASGGSTPLGTGEILLWGR